VLQTEKEIAPWKKTS